MASKDRWVTILSNPTKADVNKIIVKFIEKIIESRIDVHRQRATHNFLN